MGLFSNIWSRVARGNPATRTTSPGLAAPSSTAAGDHSTNGQVVRYLDFYRRATSPLNYAVMLDGEWGSGKTYFIKKYMADREGDSASKFLYISLYGVTSAGDIDDQIFQQLHPFLASKPVALLSKVLKGAVKAGLKIDFEGDGDSGFSADVGAPEIKAKDLFGTAKDAIFVFDDLERCPMPIDQVLGYINYFVEHHNHKAILLANESEIERRAPKDESKYYKIKEKLVGRTFRIVPVVDDALPAFVGATAEGPARDVLLRNVDLIRRVYASASYNNLRSLKQALNEFSGLYEQLPPKAQAHAELVEDVLQTLLILTLEIRKGAVDEAQVHGIATTVYSDVLLKKRGDESKSALKQIEEKYASFSFHALCPSDECWHHFFRHGSIPRDLLAESIKNSVHFRHENIEEWVKLWYYTELEETEFDLLVKEVAANFDALKYTKPGVVRHITGMYLRFAKMGLITRSVPEVKAWVEATVRRLHAAGCLEIEGQDSIRFDDGYHSLGFIELDSPEFKEVSALLQELREKSVEADYPKIASELLRLVESDSREFWQRMSHRFAGGDRYSEVPILTYIAPTDFVGAMVRCPNSEKKNITFALKERYERASHYKDLVQELEWLKAVRTELLNVSAQQGKLNRHLLTEFLGASVDKAIAHLEGVAGLNANSLSP